MNSVYRRKEQRVRLSKKLSAAMRNYYQNRKKAQVSKKWDKQADIEAIIELLPSECSYFSATAGTFFLTWKSLGIQTTHSENNYWCCKILARFNEKKQDWIMAKEGVWT